MLWLGLAIGVVIGSLAGIGLMAFVYMGKDDSWNIEGDE